jgi:hypothetical protein
MKAHFRQKMAQFSDKLIPFLGIVVRDVPTISLKFFSASDQPNDEWLISGYMVAKRASQVGIDINIPFIDPGLCPRN